jgi:hypothetical protein
MNEIETEKTNTETEGKTMKSADSLLKNPTEFTNLWLIKKKRED